jgi:DNA-binding IscR family transcriptional regulator
MARLKSAGVVVAVRAKGYRLSGPPGRFRLSTAVWALEGSRTLRPCVIAADACPRRRTCPARPVWRRMEIALHTCLSRLTLASLLRGRYRADRIAAIRGWRQPRACRSHRHMFG